MRGIAGGQTDAVTAIQRAARTDDSEIDVAVAKFGRMIGDLARKVLAG